MKGALRYLSLLTAMLTPQFMRGSKVDKTTGEKRPVKPRFVPGDRFYAYLQYKRHKGKWVVRR